MKRQYPLLCGVLFTALSLLGPQAAWGAANSKDQLKKARVSKAKKTVRAGARQDRTLQAKRATLAAVSPEGVSLVLATALPETLPSAPAVAPVPIAAPAAPVPAVYPGYNPPPAPSIGGAAENPYLPQRTRPAAPAQSAPAQSFAFAQTAPNASGSGLGSLFSDFALSIPILPGSGQSILPTIKKVYPTGEKPLVVVSFKCPTELVGVTPPTIKILREVIDLSMEGLNKTDLLSFNLQQVCQ